MQVGVTIVDADQTIVYVNPADAAMHGYTGDELLGQKSSVYAPVQPAKARPLSHDQLKQLKSWRREGLNGRKDGSVFPVEILSDVVTDDQGEPIGIVTICRDITEEKAAETALRESEERYELAVRGATDGIWDWNLVTDEFYYSPRWREILGWQKLDLESAPDRWFARVHPGDVDRVRAGLDSHLTGETPQFECEYRVLNGEDSYIWVLTRGVAVRDDDGKATRIAGSLGDITGRKVQDPLTDLPNRLLFMDRLTSALARVRRKPDSYVGVLFLDLDRFKIVNDSLGHPAGDRLLIAVAEQLSTAVRQGDTVARLGGDEFAFLVEEIPGVEIAIDLAERVHTALKEPFFVEGKEIFTTASVGIALGSGEDADAEQLIQEADTAMYSAKSRGRGRYRVFDALLRERARNQLRLETGLRHAIDEGELWLAYQAIVCPGQRTIRSFEALVRWRHPERGEIPPGDFVHFAEETGLIFRLGRWVLVNACRQLGEWKQRLPEARDLRMHVNISPKQFNHPNLVDDVREALREGGVEPGDLEIEITESAFIDDLAQATAVLDQLQEIGVKVWLDDFGTGYSSLSYIHRFRVDGLKIDRSFVSQIQTGGKELDLARSVINLARDLGIPVVAEGVETGEQLHCLEDLHCELFQGYRFSRPVEAPDAEQLLHNGDSAAWND